jgi:hypothetical protein
MKNRSFCKGEGEEAWGARDGEGEYYNIMRIIVVVVKLNNNSSYLDENLIYILIFCIIKRII